jgi:hypothetical protein
VVNKVNSATHRNIELNSPVLSMHCFVRPNGSKGWPSEMSLRRVTIASTSASAFTSDIVVEIAPSLTLLDTPPNTANPIRDYLEHKVNTADAGAGATSRVECH